MRVMTENPMGRQRSGWRYKLYRAGRGIQRNWGLYLLLLPAVVLLFCFTYLPMYGVQIAFRDFSPSQGIQGSPWVGLANFQKFFNSFQSKNLIWNTVSLSLYSLIAGFPFPIILALMVNQIRVKRFKQVLQVVTYLPHFISTVVMVGIMLILLSPSNGIYGNLARVLGVQNPVNIMGEASAFQHVYVWSDVWQHAGWDSIIYIAALAAVDPSLYEAATVDGASKIQRLWHIDVPFLIPTAVILLIMRAGNVMNLGFEKVYLMQNPLNTSISEVISTYVYKIGMISNQYSLSAAVQRGGWLFSDALLCSGCTGYSGGRRCVPRRIYRRIAARAFSQRSRSACHGSFLHQVYQNWWQSRYSRLEYGATLFAHRGNRLYGN